MSRIEESSGPSKALGSGKFDIVDVKMIVDSELTNGLNTVQLRSSSTGVPQVQYIEAYPLY